MTKMLWLFKVNFCRNMRNGGIAYHQPIIVSECNQRAAVSRARAFIKTQYPERVTLDDIQRICRTPDDVLDWD